MTTEIFGTASVMRHGATRYTEIAPDLAPEGLSALRASCAEIVKQSQGKNPVFVSSQAVRAIGTTLENMKAFGLKPDMSAIQILHLIRTVDMYYKAAFIAHVKRVTRHLTDVHEIHKTWDEHHFTHGVFRDGVICETLDATKSRFIQFLHNPLHGLCARNQGKHIVVVTHIELLGAFLQDHFDMQEGTLRPAEVAHFTYLRGINILVQFRGQKKLITKPDLFPFTSE